MRLPAPYAQSRPLAIETVSLARPGPGVINRDRPRRMPVALGDGVM